MTVTLTDGDGDQVTSTVTDISGQISFLDDGPTAPTVTVSAATVGVDETPGVQTTGGASDVAGSTAITFNGARPRLRRCSLALPTRASIRMFPVASKDNGALSFASSGASSIVSVGTLTYGADGPAASGSETFNLSLLKTTSNLTLTDGEAITLSQSGNMILGTVTGGGAFSGQVAYAITMDPLTGKVYVADYLSLHQDSLTTTPNDWSGADVWHDWRDGDADRRRRRPGHLDGDRHQRPDQLLRRWSDGCRRCRRARRRLALTRRLAVQTTGGASDVAGSTAITFNGGATTVAALFTSVANKGVDPDVPVLRWTMAR